MHFCRLTSPYSKRCTDMLRILPHPDIEMADRLRHTDAVSEPNMGAVIGISMVSATVQDSDSATRRDCLNEAIPSRIPRLAMHINLSRLTRSVTSVFLLTTMFFYSSFPTADPSSQASTQVLPYALQCPSRPSRKKIIGPCPADSG